MSCSSCGGCGCNVCCEDSCDPNNEPLSSALENFIEAIFGSLTKSCINNEIVWILPCDLTTGNALLPRNSGEGVACYLLRLFNSIQTLSMTCLDFRKIFINGNCYDTWQAAYDANSTVAATTAMIFGKGSFGNLTLTSNYNSFINIVGLSNTDSVLGNVSAPGLTFNANINKVTIGAINATTTLTSSGAKVIGQIASLTSSSLMRDVIFSTPAANQDCILDLSGDGAQFQNCLFVPNGTGSSVNATVARTIIAYGILHKNGFGVNVSLSEGNDLTSPNLLAP